MKHFPLALAFVPVFMAVSGADARPQPSTLPLPAALQPKPADAPPAFESQVAPVFRCIFEDRSRMVIVRPAPDLWVAFNPGTCGVQKVWRGGMKFRGKVWDFSQDNCAAADGVAVLAQAPSMLASLDDLPVMTGGWTASGLEMPKSGGRGEGWRFMRPDSSLISPVFDASGWQRVFIAFDETGRAGPFAVDVSDNVGVGWRAQSFLSTTHGTSDTDWQFNFKQLEKPGPQLRVRWTLAAGTTDKRIRNVRIFGDKVPWSIVIDGKAAAVTPVWRGYERPAAAAAPGAPVCTLLYDLRFGEGRTAEVRDEIRDAGGAGITRSIRISGVPIGSQVRFVPPFVDSHAVCSLTMQSGEVSELRNASYVDFPADAAGGVSFVLTTTAKEHP